MASSVSKRLNFLGPRKTTCVKQELGNRGSPCQVNQEHLMKGLLLSVCWAASAVRCKPKGLIKGFL
ncbi:Hypothetical protein SMAX5B_003664 [Scophthalmus maximus]|uniref:Uncharacterized protein n=1 Tax=Scophthalmus maximus TaxID=52904 RepID=A0A2U9CHR4_SCOMX|nr:Hypothetical protein SMAX5B_003664 [Scophthalmus maximus]